MGKFMNFLTDNPMRKLVFSIGLLLFHKQNAEYLFKMLKYSEKSN